MKQAFILVVVIAVFALGFMLARPGVQKSEDSSVKPTGETAMKPTPYTTPPTMSVDVTKKYDAVMRTSKGKMTIELYASESPKTVNNFIFLARQGFYDHTVFHRIIKGFMIQGGDPNGDGSGGPGYRFEDEPITRAYTRGTLAMANAGPNTNGSQFFIMHADYALPKNYVIFGGIKSGDTESLATLDAIASTATVVGRTGEQSTPTEKITVESVIIEVRQ